MLPKKIAEQRKKNLKTTNIFFEKKGDSKFGRKLKNTIFLV